MFRVVGWALIALGVVLVVLLVIGPPRDTARILMAAGALLVGVCLVLSTPIKFEKTIAYGMLGPEKVSDLRQNSRNVAPNSALQRTGEHKVHAAGVQRRRAQGRYCARVLEGRWPAAELGS
jgi:hypothetical protein